MSDSNSYHPVLELAWKRFAELDANSERTQDSYFAQRRWIAILGVVAVLLAIIVDRYSADYPDWLATLLKYLLILTPLVGSGIAAFGKDFQQGKKYLAMRGAAEEILKEIYLYRTIFKNQKDRHKRLNERLAKIQKEMFKGVSGELVLKPYDGNLPPYYNPTEGRGDPGFMDLDGESYLELRLEDQLAWHIKKNRELERKRMMIKALIIIFGVGGAFFAGIGDGEFSVWVALTAAIASAFVGWEELQGLDETVGNYSRVILELNIIRDYWLTLDESEKTEEEFIKLVKGTEDVLWTQHSQWISNMAENFAETEGEEAKLVEDIIQKARESDQQLQKKIADEAYGVIEHPMDQAVEQVALGVEDSAADVMDHMARISDEVPDGFEEETVEEDAEITSAVDAALAEASVVAEEDFVDEVFVDEVIEEVPEEEFVDEVFDDGEEGDVFDTISDEENLFDVDGEFVDEVFDDDEGEVFG